MITPCANVELAIVFPGSGVIVRHSLPAISWQTTQRRAGCDPVWDVAILVMVADEWIPMEGGEAAVSVLVVVTPLTANAIATCLVKNINPVGVSYKEIAELPGATCAIDRPKHIDSRGGGVMQVEKLKFDGNTAEGCADPDIRRYIGAHKMFAVCNRRARTDWKIAFKAFV
jgi:hypothetical protein